MDEKNYITALVGSLLGLLPLVVSVFISWLEKRSRIARKEEAIDFAQRQVTFLSAWMQAREQSDSDQQITPIKKEVGAELDQIKAHVDAMMDIPHDKPMVKTDERNFFQRLFLLYAPYTADGWVYRGLFFMCLGGVILLFIVGGLPDPTSGPMTFSDWASLGFLSLPFLVIAVIFHALAIRCDHRAEKIFPSVPGK